MKCPKCNYISFDYNQVCPKCSKDISSEQQRMSLPAYKPAPPYLLASLLGESAPSEEAILSEGQGFDFDLELEEGAELEKTIAGVATPDLTESGLLEESEGEIELLEPLSGPEFEEETSQDSKNLSQENPELTVTLSGDDEGEEPTVNLDDLPLSQPGDGIDALMEETIEEEDLGIDLEDLALDDIASPSQGLRKAGALNDAEKITLVIDTNGSKESKGIEETEVELELEKIEDK